MGTLGLVGTAMLITGQWLFEPQLYRIEENLNASVEEPKTTKSAMSANNESLPPEEPPGQVATAASRREVSILSGDVTLETYDHPIMGNPGAKYVLVNLFDYTCKDCRTLHRHLAQACDRYGDQLAVVVLPVPMNTDCNKSISSTHEDHKNACDYARLALAVWTVDRSKFERFHHWLFTPRRPPSVDEATNYAARLVGREPLEDHRQSSSVNKRIRRYTVLHQKAGGGRIPKTLLEKDVITGHTTSPKQLFDLLESILNVVPEGP